MFISSFSSLSFIYVIPIYLFNNLVSGLSICAMYSYLVHPVYTETRCRERGTCDPDNNEEDPDSCIKRLLMKGRTDTRFKESRVTIEECDAMVTSDPDCSNVFHYDIDDNVCECYHSAECCGGGCELDQNGEEEYEIYQVDPGLPNPTCEGGVLSADGSLCCDASCGDACGQEGDTCQEAGLCCETALGKECSSSSFPCVM